MANANFPGKRTLQIHFQETSDQKDLNKGDTSAKEEPFEEYNLYNIISTGGVRIPGSTYYRTYSASQKKIPPRGPDIFSFFSQMVENL